MIVSFSFPFYRLPIKVFVVVVKIINSGVS
jgi:hypothetical protein